MLLESVFGINLAVDVFRTRPRDEYEFGTFNHEYKKMMIYESIHAWWHVKLPKALSKLMGFRGC